jgi:hypothetical protein
MSIYGSLFEGKTMSHVHHQPTDCHGIAIRNDPHRKAALIDLQQARIALTNPRASPGTEQLAIETIGAGLVRDWVTGLRADNHSRKCRHN